MTSLFTHDARVKCGVGVMSCCRYRVREYMVGLEAKIAKAGSRVVKLDEDGNITTATGPARSDNPMTK